MELEYPKHLFWEELVISENFLNPFNIFSDFID